MPSDNLTLRTTIRNQRHSLTLEQRQQSAEKISQHYIKSDFFQKAQHIAVYLDVQGEVATDHIIEAIFKANKHCYLPCLSKNPQLGLHFTEYTRNTPLQKNHFGILEPANEPNNRILSENLECVCVPLVAFDDNGNRLGMGLGYYDRTFAFTKINEKAVPLIGLAYAFQRSEKIIVNSWDIPLSGVVTEQGLQIYSPNIK